MASDIYSWAITAWEILTTRLPYHNENNQPVLNFLSLKSQNSIVSGRLRPDLLAIRSDCPSEILTLIQKAWSSEPRERPSMAKCVLSLIEIVSENRGNEGIDLPGQVGR
jgi:serine/threonine protein kinase